VKFFFFHFFFFYYFFFFFLSIRSSYKRCILQADIPLSRQNNLNIFSPPSRFRTDLRDNIGPRVTVYSWENDEEISGGQENFEKKFFYFYGKKFFHLCDFTRRINHKNFLENLDIVGTVNFPGKVWVISAAGKWIGVEMKPTGGPQIFKEISSPKMEKISVVCKKNNHKNFSPAKKIFLLGTENGKIQFWRENSEFGLECILER
jgi:hypothetical protein